MNRLIILAATATFCATPVAFADSPDPNAQQAVNDASAGIQTLIKPGRYMGRNSAGEPCTVVVKAGPNGLIINAWNNKAVDFKRVIKNPKTGTFNRITTRKDGQQEWAHFELNYRPDPDLGTGIEPVGQMADLAQLPNQGAFSSLVRGYDFNKDKKTVELSTNKLEYAFEDDDRYIKNGEDLVRRTPTDPKDVDYKPNAANVRLVKRQYSMSLSDTPENGLAVTLNTSMARAISAPKFTNNAYAKWKATDKKESFRPSQSLTCSKLVATGTAPNKGKAYDRDNPPPSAVH
ncbi:MAG: hypothetical protein JST16_13045 [Bdellovibrionales bacterium]|nr:hypothetical protein [Bdellovibrionales bacterium]